MAFPSPSEKQARILWTSITALAIGILLALMGILIVAFGWVINRLSSVLLPLAIAGIIAYLLDPVVDYFVKKRMPRAWAILLVFFLAFLTFSGLLATVVPGLVIETSSLIENLEEKDWKQYRNQLREKLQQLMQKSPFQLPDLPWLSAQSNPDPSTNASPPAVPALTNASAAATNALAGATNGAAEGPGAASGTSSIWSTQIGEKILTWTSETIPKIGRWFLDQLSKVASWGGFLIGLSLVPVYAYYFLLEKRGIEKNWTDYLPIHESWIKDELVFVLHSINYYLILFFRGQVLVALCDGALLTIGFLAIGLNYAFLLGFVAGLLSIVPYLGVLLSLIPTLALAAIQFGDWLHPLLVLLIFGLVQAAEGLVISPKIMGDRVGLHPLTIIIAVMVGTTLMGGILGGILAIPLTAALRVLMFRYVWKKRDNPAIKAEGAAQSG